MSFITLNHSENLFHRTKPIFVILDQIWFEFIPDDNNLVVETYFKYKSEEIKFQIYSIYFTLKSLSLLF